MKNIFKLAGPFLALQLALSTGGSGARGQTPELVLRRGHTMPVSALDYSRDGRLLATASGDQTVTLWDVETGLELRSFSGLTGNANHTPDYVAFSPDAKLLAAGTPLLGKVTVWDVAGGKVLKVIDDGVAFNLVFSADGRSLVGAAWSESESRLYLKKWAVGGWGETHKVALPTKGYPGALRISPDARLAAYFEKPNHVAQSKAPKVVNKTIRVIDVETAKSVNSFEVEVSEEIPGKLSFSRSGRELAFNDGQSLKIFDLANGRALQTITINDKSSDLDLNLSPDGKMIAGRLHHRGRTIDENHYSLKLWDVASGKELRTIIKDAAGFSYNLEFSPAGDRIALARETDLTLLGVGSGEEMHLQRDGNGAYSQFTLENGHKSLLLFGERSIRRLSLLENSYPRTFFDGAASLSGNQRVAAKVADGGLSQELFLYEVSSKRLLLRVTDLSPLFSYAISSDGNLLAVNDGGSIYVFDPAATAAGKTVTKEGSTRSLKQKHLVTGMRFSPGGDLLYVSTPQEPAITVWDVKQARELRKTNAYPEEVATDALVNEIYTWGLSHDGRLLASSERTGKIHLWDTAANAELFTLAGHSFKDSFNTGAVNVLSFDPTGTLLASGSADKTMKLWDVKTGRELRTFVGHTAGVGNLEFVAGGRLLISSGDDGTIRFWDVRSGQLLGTLVAAGDDWIVSTPEGLFDGTPAAWQRLVWRFDNNTFNFAPVEAFFNEFFHPGLLQEIFAGKRPVPPGGKDIAKVDRRRPAVSVSLSGGQAPTAALAARTATVRVEIADNAGAPALDTHPAAGGARDVRLFRNGSLVRAWRGDVLKGQKSVVLEAAVPVVAGENRFTAYAFNHDNVKSSDATLVVTGGEGLARAGTAYVLAVGVNSYANPQYDLKYAVADAQAFAAEFKGQQEKLGRYAQIEVIMLLDKQATKANVLGALAQVSAKAQPEDAVIVYFAGHGTAEGRHFYLIPHDIGYAGPREQLKVDPAGLRTMLRHGISDRELEEAVAGIDAGQMLLVIDACNSGQALEAEEKRRGPMNSAGLAQLAYEKGMYVLTASQSFQFANESPLLGHGYLTYALVEKGLKVAEADIDRDGIVYAREWFSFATDEVPKVYEEQMRKQSDEQLAQLRARKRNSGLEGVDDVQRPRFFYRREAEPKPLVVARPGAAPNVSR